MPITSDILGRRLYSFLCISFVYYPFPAYRWRGWPMSIPPNLKARFDNDCNRLHMRLYTQLFCSFATSWDTGWEITDEGVDDDRDFTLESVNAYIRFYTQLFRLYTILSWSRVRGLICWYPNHIWFCVWKRLCSSVFRVYIPICVHNYYVFIHLYLFRNYGGGGWLMIYHPLLSSDLKTVIFSCIFSCIRL